MPAGSVRYINGIAIIQGTPTEPLSGPALFLRLSRVRAAGKPERMIASLSMARPRPGGYVIKELLGEMEMDPPAAVRKAVAIAQRGNVHEVYLNADLDALPAPPVQALG